MFKSIAKKGTRKIKIFLRMLIGDFFGFKHSLSSGILIVVRRPSDFSTYSEIFVDGYYDRAIHDAIMNSSNEINILDLGSNVGFFALRFADVLRRYYSQQVDKQVNITMVEGTNSVAKKSIIRLEHNKGKIGSYEVINGLVGRKTGFGFISSEYEYAYNSVVATRKKKLIKVDYYNLQQKLSEKIYDLIKCDIEGAEEMFIETYGDLLLKQSRLVFEFHHKMCNTQRCDCLLKLQGFNSMVLYANEDISMAYYYH